MENSESKEQVKSNKNERADIKPRAAVFSIFCSVLVGICWFFRDFEFRHAVTTGEQGESWFMLDANIFLRRGLIIFAVIALLTGLKAVYKRAKVLDFVAFLVAVVITLAVGYLVFQMGGKGFWMGR